jgi:Zn-dependent protease
MDGLIIFVVKIVIVVYSVVIHELSHGLMANAMGDPTAKQMGRLTLNPIKHLDMFGSIILPILLYTTTGFIFGYAKPVPYNPLLLRDKKYGPAKVALVGPASNIALAILFGLTIRFLPFVVFSSIVQELFVFIVSLNLVLAVFNLMPIPPLDGHWLLMTFLPDRFNNFKMFLYKYSIPIFVFFVLFIFPVLSFIVTHLFGLITGIKL